MVKVVDCSLFSCDESASNSYRFSFVNDIENGIFIFIINPVQLSDKGTIIGCYDGNIEKKITLTVLGKLILNAFISPIV